MLLIFIGAKHISKSEDNLLTPKCDSSVHRTSWSGDTPLGGQAFSGGSFTDTPMSMCLKSNYVSEPAIVVSKSPAVARLPKTLCCASSAESLDYPESLECPDSSVAEPRSQTGPTLLRIKTEPAADLQAVAKDSFTEVNKTGDTPVPPPVVCEDAGASRCTAQQSLLASEQNITFGQIEIAALSPLHIDSAIFEPGAFCTPAVKADLRAAPVASLNSSTAGDSESEAEQANCSRLIDALDIQSPARFTLQSTPYKPDLELRRNLNLGTPPRVGTEVGTVHQEADEFSPDAGAETQSQQALSPRSQESEKQRVADHIQHFNKLTLQSPRRAKARQIRSPLKFQRTPVRQTVRRMNSLLEEGRRPTRTARLSPGAQVTKAVSLESGLSPHPQLQPAQAGPRANNKKKPPPVPPKKPSTLTRKVKPCALGDMTNKVQTKTKADSGVPDASGAQKPLVQQVAEKDMNHYRGSPRNPLNQARLMSATRPVDL